MLHYLFLPGLNGDARIFDRLAPSLKPVSIVEWIPAKRGESIAQYAARLLSEGLPQSDKLVVVGVSFGGVIAREIAARFSAKACVLISSIRDETQLALSHRAARFLAPLLTEPFLAAVGQSAAHAPITMRTQSTFLTANLPNEDAAWRRWAISAFLRWRDTPALDRIPSLQIHGARDTTFPAPPVAPDILIEDGGHLIALTHAEQIAEQIRRFVATL